MQPSEVHFMLTGRQAEPSHLAFYRAGKMGFSDKALDKDRFLAVAMLTLQKTMRAGIKNASRVILLYPQSHEKWVSSEFDDISAVAFKNIQKYPGTPKARADLARVIGNCFKVVFYHSRLLQLPEEPDAWTSFGFSKDDPIPAWTRDGLL